MEKEICFEMEKQIETTRNIDVLRFLFRRGEEEIGVNLRREMIFLQCPGVFYVRKGDLEETLEYVDFLMCKEA